MLWYSLPWATRYPLHYGSFAKVLFFSLISFSCKTHSPIIATDCADLVVTRPCLFSCVLGLLNTCISLAVHPSTQIQWTTSSISALSLAATSTLIYSGLALYTFRKLCNIRKKDSKHRRTDSESITLLPENELQRQQLLRLLVQKESDKKSSPNQSTYWIDIPDSLKLGRQAKSSSPFLIPPSSIPEGRRQSFVSSPLEEQFARMRGQVQEVPVDRKLRALESARERSLENRSREVSTTPPIIINTRTPQDTGDIPLSERHPLEREEFIRGTRAKNDFHAGGVYRPEDQDEEYSFDPNGQGRRMEIELEDRGRMENELEGTGTGSTGTQNIQSELEDRGRVTRPRGEYAAALSPRIVRVQTDGWPGR